MNLHKVLFKFRRLCDYCKGTRCREKNHTYLPLVAKWSEKRYTTNEKAAIFDMCLSSLSKLAFGQLNVPIDLRPCGLNRRAEDLSIHDNLCPHRFRARRTSKQDMLHKLVATSERGMHKGFKTDEQKKKIPLYPVACSLRSPHMPFHPPMWYQRVSVAQ
ncbi:hypothetical protein BDV97DRAFT_7005 [Delphinella strobiligena]|nr:hypothetical protein BDV97DRAFT_7005 [Delphinella strobiligena]